jgi:hypothetical protein
MAQKESAVAHYGATADNASECVMCEIFIDIDNVCHCGAEKNILAICPAKK